MARITYTITTSMKLMDICVSCVSTSGSASTRVARTSRRTVSEANRWETDEGNGDTLPRRPVALPAPDL